MKRSILFILTLSLTIPAVSLAAERDLSSDLAGRILLQVEEHGQAWYLNPVDSKRYYLRDGDEAYRLMRDFGLGITNTDLAKLPTTKGQSGDQALAKRLSGRIVLQVQEHGEAWYINPADGLRYYLQDGPAAYQIMRQLSLGITNADLGTIAISGQTVQPETAFDDIAYVKYSGGNFVVDRYGDQVLPPASMTKLMTAIIIAEQYPNWSNQVTITKEILDYPKIFVGNDGTSEVNLKEGDKLGVYDLLVALLISSSNQSARALVTSTGLSHQEFLDKMNAKAKELGLTNTHFDDVAGLSTETVTTAKEMAKIAEEAFSLAAIQSIYAQSSHSFYVVDAQGEFHKIVVVDRNYSLQKYQPDAVKTGFLNEAQRTVVLKKGDDIVVVMHAPSNSERNKILDILLN